MDILIQFDQTRAYTIELSFQEWSEYSDDDIGKIFSFKRVQQIYFAEKQDVNIIIKKFKINFIKSIYDVLVNGSPSSINDFEVNNLFFSESLRYHTYFNKRIFIDNLGNIKNDVSLKGYGNIIESSLEKIAELKDIRRLWYVCKDRTIVCNDCEYRYMCLDKREPIQLPGNADLWSHSTECNYNPFVAKWKGEEGYITVAQCGTFAKGVGFVVDKRIVL